MEKNQDKIWEWPGDEGTEIADGGKSCRSIGKPASMTDGSEGVHTCIWSPEGKDLHLITSLLLS